MGATGGSISQAHRVVPPDAWAANRGASSPCTSSSPPSTCAGCATTTPSSSVYAVRLDRGLSPPEVFDTVPGTKWELERGLDDRQYIVPGGGGFGEIMNNVYV